MGFVFKGVHNSRVNLSRSKGLRLPPVILGNTDFPHACPIVIGDRSKYHGNGNPASIG
jgi:hypothetical protein